MASSGPRAARMLAIVLAAAASVWPASAQKAPSSAEGRGAHSLELLIRIPREGTPNGMLTRICRPHADGPTPLVVVNHGSPPVAEDRKTRKPSGCGEAARFFTARGFAVAFPLRRGYGETGGPWAEDYGRCEAPDFLGAGQATADDIAVALAHLRTLPFIDRSPAIIVGQSAGGWGTLAFASRAPREAATFINFAGGRGARPKRATGNCSPEALVAAAAALGRATRAETLWIYTRNDRSFSDVFSRRMHEAYQKAGGRARYELLGDFEDDGHKLFFARGGSRIWGPIVGAWLDRASAR